MITIPLTDVTPYYEDRSGAETDDQCGMRFWWNRLEGERGIVPSEEAFALTIGRETHEDLALIGGLPDEDLAPDALAEMLGEITGPLTSDDLAVTEKMEVLYRRLGWTAAFALYVEPRIRETFTTVEIEKEIFLDRSPLWIAVTPDRVLEHKQDHYLAYKEYKTTISAGQKWIQSWPFQIQTHLGIAAVQEELGTNVAFAQIMGLMKGNYIGGYLSHPYVWGWRSSKTGKWEHEYTKARGAEWVRTPVWEFEGGIVQWVRNLGAEIAANQFPHSAPVFLNERMLNDWVERRLSRQREIRENLLECRTSWDVRRLLFEQRTRNCRPPFGDACPYLAACWNAAVQAAPLASSLYQPRQPHHELELITEKL